MALGKLIQFSLGGGTMYFYYKSGLWRNSDETIKNYEKLRKEGLELYRTYPSVVNIIETSQSHFSSTIAPAVESATKFQKEWLDFDLYWVTSGDGIVKPTWNKSISWICDFLGHAPEDIKYAGKEGWEKLKVTFSEANTATATPKSK